MEGFGVYSIVTENAQVTVWIAETHSEVRRFKAQALAGYRVEAVDVSPDETRIVTGSHDKAVLFGLSQLASVSSFRSRYIVKLRPRDQRSRFNP